jgi:outer membrane protein TolC
MLSGLFLSGCAVGPDYTEPAQMLSDVWVEPPIAAVPTELDHWWLDFDDALVSRYVALAQDANKDIEIAAARLAQARAQSKVARSTLLPSIGAGASYSSLRISEQNLNNPGGLLPPSLEVLTTPEKSR